jgi:hypothetical protein
MPSKPRLKSLLEAYFNNVHPIRVFAFLHKPSFMRLLDEGLLTGTADQALLYILCAQGARFYTLDYYESAGGLSDDQVQTAGKQWAKCAEKLLFAEYGIISATKLKTLVLLHDFETRMGNYAQSFLLSGIITRMAHVLQINVEVSTDILGREDTYTPNDATTRENRRRLMWSCYTIDMSAGSGVDQLTLLNEEDIKIQLPCSDGQFLYQVPCVTARLERYQVLDFIPSEDVPDKPWENMGFSAHYVRIIFIWKKVLRYQLFGRSY